MLFLDEPTTGLDLTSRNELWEMIRQLVADGTTVLLTTQYLEEADRLAARIAVVDGGKVIANDTPAPEVRTGQHRRRDAPSGRRPGRTGFALLTGSVNGEVEREGTRSASPRTGARTC